MKYCSKMALLGLFYGSCSFAAVPVDGWYGGLNLGGNMMNKLNVAIADPFDPLNSTSSATIKRSIGGNGGGQIGYRLCNFRFEGQLFLGYTPYTELDVDGLKIKKGSSTVEYTDTVYYTNPGTTTTVTSGGTTTTTSTGGTSGSTTINGTIANPKPFMSGQTIMGAAFFNVYYDFWDEDNDPSFIPYVGLGIGYSTIRNSLSYSIPLVTDPYGTVVTGNAMIGDQYVAARTKKYSINASAPLGQGIVGVNYFFSDSTSLGLDYRYMISSVVSKFGSRVTLNTLNLNLNFSFDDSE
ncbi:MAG: hypothetical protein LCH30_07345 [Proteobacteria bacterium]|nr:hypothetical protein [Pseudomonadota bacterium]